MSLIIATGSNLDHPIQNLSEAKSTLKKEFKLLFESKIYLSKAVDYENQPDFYNQVLEFEIPEKSPQEVMKRLLEIEAFMGRKRDISRGPRTIDLDILFWGNLSIQTYDLIVPHPRWMERSFVVKPLSELPFFQTIKKCFTIPNTFKVDAYPIN